MRRSAVGLVTVGVAAALSVSACGGGSSNKSSGGSGSSSSSGGSGAITAACKLSNPPTSNAKLPSNQASGQKATGKVGVILPDTTSSTRYTLYDAPLLK